MVISDKEDAAPEVVTRRMEDAIRRALNTPPVPAKELVGKSERAIAQRESRVRKSSRSKPKEP